jgi:predicted SAM-dependent methyltransferase
MLAHLGCGKRRLAGYVHVDLADYPHIDHRHDIRTLPMFPDSSLNGIYASHSLEYFDRVEVVEVLAEWRRVLRPGGFLRLAVPDFAALNAVYAETGDIAQVLGPIYGRWSPTPGLVIYHKTAYDAASLTAVLKEAGFVGVRPWDWRQVFTGENAGFDDYSQAYSPHMDKENGRLMSLNLEADKPEA